MIKRIQLIIILLVTFNTSTKSQVVFSGHWYENFDLMPVNSSPDGWQTWISTGNFVVLTNNHENNGGAVVNNVISCNLNNNLYKDSVLTPMLTSHGAGSFCTINYRIGNFNDTVFDSHHNLAIGDTCYLIIYKCLGEQIKSSIISKKIHAGNQFTNGIDGFSLEEFTLPTITQSDTFRIGIKITKTSNDNYWYDIDQIGVTFITKITALKNINFDKTYPIPASTFFFFETNNIVNEVIITNMLGESIPFRINKDMHKYYIEFENTIKSGVYNVSIISNSGTTNKKIILEN